jgi:transcriptional regulator with XRE-family HTH domain
VNRGYQGRYTDAMHDDADALDVARAGAAFAARREELGISQRELAAKKVISAPALISFEKGRRWPRERTRAKLEQVAMWPPGTLANLSAGGKAPVSGAEESSDAEGGPSEVIAGAVTVAVEQVLATIDNLPGDDDATFTERVRSSRSWPRSTICPMTMTTRRSLSGCARSWRTCAAWRPSRPGRCAAARAHRK